MSLIHKLNELAEELIGNHPAVDHGGCCVVAAQMAKHLSRHVPVNIIALHCPWEEDGNRDLNEIRPNINPLSMDDWYENGIDFHHILIEFKHGNRWFVFDATSGVEPRKGVERRRHDGSFTLEEATALANEDDWNPEFDRDEIPVVRRRVTKFFNKHIH